MKKNILIGVLTFMFALSLGFGLIQKSEADRLKLELEAAEQKAAEAQVAAEKNAMEAMRQRALAAENARLAEEAAKRPK